PYGGPRNFSFAVRGRDFLREAPTQEPDQAVSIRPRMPPTRLPRKKAVALALLEQSSVFVHLDPRDEKVRVPAWFKKQPQLVLQIGLNMAIPIKDLQVDE